MGPRLPPSQMKIVFVYLDLILSPETGGEIRGIHEARNWDDNPIHLTERVLEHMGFLFLTSSILRNIGSTLQIALLEKHTNLFPKY